MFLQTKPKYPLNTLKNLTNILTFNKFLYQNNIIFEQIQGIPLGCSVSITVTDVKFRIS